MGEIQVVEIAQDQAHKKYLVILDHAELIVSGMCLEPGAHVLRHVAVESNPEQEKSKQKQLLVAQLVLVMRPRLKLAMKMLAQFLLIVHGVPTAIGPNVQRAVVVEPKSEREKLQLRPEMEEHDVTEPTLISNFAMNFLAQSTAWGMTTAHGPNVTRIVAEEPSTEPELYTSKHNLEESHVRVVPKKKSLVMKTHVQ